MRTFLKNSSGFLFFLVLLLAAGCRDNLVVDNSDQNFPLTLQAQSANDKVTLKWEAANVSNFEKYVVLRSRNPIPTGLRPLFSTTDQEIILQSDDIKTTEFVDENLPIVEKLYYKLYISIDDRFIESDAVVINFDNLLVDGNGSVVKFVADSSWVILGDEFTGTLRVINYNTKEVKANRTVQFTNTDNMCLDVAVENGKQVLYWWAGYNNFYKFSLPDLTQLNLWPVPFSGFSVLVDDEFVYTTQYDYNQSFSPRRKTDLSVVKAHYRTDYYTHRTLAMLDKQTNRIVEASAYRIMVYNVNQTTGDVTNLVERSTNTFNVFYREMPVAKNGQYFIAQYDGSVYDQNLNLVTTVPFLNNGYTDVDFSPDGQFIYAVYQDFTFGNGTLIQKFRFPSMESVASRRFNNISPRSVEAIEGGVVFVGGSVNGFNQVLVKKIEL